MTLRNPVVIAHRGASGYWPEHTETAYRQAIKMGADHIEPDLVFTKDGHLICRHDRYLGTTTNVADFPEFEDRKRIKPGLVEAQWYAEDFTLEELKALRCRQLWPTRTAEHNDQDKILTFEDLLVLIKQAAQVEGRTIGVCPEVKHAPDLLELGHDFLPLALDQMAEHGFGAPELPAQFQSFDHKTLQRAREMTDIPLVQLIRNEDFSFQTLKPSSVAEEAEPYADVIAPHKSLIIDQKGQDTGLLDRCRAMGKEVHVWAFVDEMVNPHFASMEDEIRAHLDLGIDGLFCDFPDRAVKLRNEFLEGTNS